MSRIVALVATACLSLALLAGCGDSETPAAPTTDPLVISVTFDGDDVTPAGDRVEVAVGQPIELDVTADAAGEIHIHSDPEQEVEYAAGTSTIKVAPVSRPGIVDVESHTLGKTIVQLEAK